MFPVTLHSPALVFGFWLKGLVACGEFIFHIIPLTNFLNESGPESEFWEMVRQDCESCPGSGLASSGNSGLHLWRLCLFFIFNHFDCIGWWKSPVSHSVLITSTVILQSSECLYLNCMWMWCCVVYLWRGIRRNLENNYATKLENEPW